MKNTITFLLLVWSLTSFAQHNKILLTNGTIHVGNGEVVPTGLIGVEFGKITLVKNSLAYTIDRSSWDTIIDLKGQHVYPGFIAPNSTLGLTEIDAVRATRDFDETGHFNPHVRAQIAYNVESDVMATVKTNGVLMVQATPRGGRISGRSALMFTEGWNWEDATVKANDGVHVNWPRSLERSKENRDVKTIAKAYEEQKRELYLFFEAAKAYGKGNKAEYDARYDAMKDCFNGESRVYFHADHLQQLQDVIDFAKHFELPYPVIVGGYDSYLITRILKDAKIPVMLPRLHSLPANDDDPVDLPYRLPTLLQDGGVLFCLQNEGDMEAMNARNLPFLAGTAYAYGLTEEQAIASVTLNTCKIIGVEKYFGSIEKDKNATLFVSEGNALDMRTNNVTLILVNGKLVPVTNRQMDLWKRYENKR